MRLRLNPFMVAAQSRQHGGKVNVGGLQLLVFGLSVVLPQQARRIGCWRTVFHTRSIAFDHDLKLRNALRDT
ncbi:hypothetical protein S58_53710 [Bradyrhizobium oligotrophicum S58]|uniref:Uncharacterized protein n=1 Tax=Bradyrhizobium oligotrophicum S58 TaxID=1245469 RepID=M4ZC36_9BRAD|nr:hypothetical protein S58_53710 [Bradyrhizobium oligotrophicum S58]